MSMSDVSSIKPQFNILRKKFYYIPIKYFVLKENIQTSISKDKKDKLTFLAVAYKALLLIIKKLLRNLTILYKSILLIVSKRMIILESKIPYALLLVHRFKNKICFRNSFHSIIKYLHVLSKLRCLFSVLFNPRFKLF